MEIEAGLEVGIPQASLDIVDKMYSDFPVVSSLVEAGPSKWAVSLTIFFSSHPVLLSSS